MFIFRLSFVLINLNPFLLTFSARIKWCNVFVCIRSASVEMWWWQPALSRTSQKEKGVLKAGANLLPRQPQLAGFQQQRTFAFQNWP